jgi:hypothetical protein
MILRSQTTMLGLAALLTALTACGAEDAGPLIDIVPASPEVWPGETVTFTATSLASEDPVTWAVLEEDGGTIDETGTYTAPETEGTYTVVAESSPLTQTTSVRVKKNVRVSVSPSLATVEPGASLTFGASVTGNVKTVTWSVAEGAAGGTITAAGVYTAPQTDGDYTVVATSTADPTKSGLATVTVTAATLEPSLATVSVAISPQSASVDAGSTLQFTATVTGTTDSRVNWWVAESAGGTVSANGLYTAPATAGTYHVVAQSAADTSKTSSATVTVLAAPTPTATESSTSTVSGVGTGTSYTPSYVTTVTGGGAMPSWTTNVITASCAGNGTTDDSGCIQAALDAGRDQGKPVVLPYTSSYYRITRVLSVYGSFGGVGAGRPQIRMTTAGATASQSALRLMPNRSGWLYNLHLVGTFDGSNASGEWAHNVDVGNVNGFTIKGLLMENPMGDCIGTDWSAWDGFRDSFSRNVLVTNNTCVNPRRCGVALVMHNRRWAIMNNVIDKQVNYVSGIDFEPEHNSTIVDVEVGYNKFIMNNRVNPGGAGGSANGKAIAFWNPGSTNPGTNYYFHHNFGTFGTGFRQGGWGYIVDTANAEGPNPQP